MMNDTIKVGGWTGWAVERSVTEATRPIVQSHIFSHSLWFYL
jgi:hypothetical protein